ncbi:aldo/keto reductase [Pseudomonas sp. EpS/L25]|uniref:aldo/keto reductase n=1 Tax=Pseudomonas sp. EpS/L25 TaxID=1749078 RepID=UPI0007437FEF|nr:aldo/keto reductase [Pseudomonas sp. EpS/L25]KUM39543.1 aldo/keto reductase [Pseudomonas sp. EpS/L25]
MLQRRLGRNGPLVSALGLGCMGMSEFYGATDEAEALATLDLALERGVTLLDTADAYGPHRNEELLGRALRGRRERVFLATKFGLVRSDDPNTRVVNGRPEYVRQAVDGSLRRLGVERIDLYYQHRVDPEVPIEETVGAMAELVQAGKVRYLGLSEASSETLSRAHRVHPIAALQSEFSLWSRDPQEHGVLATCRELGVALVAYSPLGRGFLTGALKSPDDFAADDYRRLSPRFQGENFQRNLELVERVRALATAKGVTPGQVALAWVLAQGEDVVPIPGTRRRHYLLENLAALEVQLTDHEKVELDNLFTPGTVAGTRYPAAWMQLVER